MKVLSSVISEYSEWNKQNGAPSLCPRFEAIGDLLRLWITIEKTFDIVVNLRISPYKLVCFE